MEQQQQLHQPNEINMAANDCTSFIRIYYVLTTETAQNTISIVDLVKTKRNAYELLAANDRERARNG